ncbi:LPXTG cell wall anchor domain-containing protein [Streptomyces hoynatensis]|uniref:LPXTG cell wall anchor domain-containing protein n=1 Tax=Streptomyces hoynatensis TaxID=1141874 RepID=A0A3A9YN08_9ACTN|nr:LPXTG cell wall anchor domain-containing protein [Streptomyces hoynatensis]RKN37482.1 LPXTG cell wall anchor domain-containing protein [Streptomyces hoynatensis]
MRTPQVLGAAAAAAVGILAFAPAALATPPGDNGTVKIHDATTDEELPRNEPHVCTFYLQSFGFDAGQEVSWTITEVPPTGSGDTVAESGALVLDGEGQGRSDDLALPPGHYRLTWQFEGENGAAKHKVFWSDCADGEEPPAEGEEPPAEDAPGDEETGGEEAGGTTPDGEAEEPVAEETAAAEPGGDLAETGAGLPATPMVAGAAVLLAAGGYLVVRRRQAASRR